MMTREQAAQEVMRRHDILKKAAESSSRLVAFCKSLKKDDPRLAVLKRVAEVTHKLSEQVLEEMRLYASLAGEVPESVLRDRLK